MRRPLSKIYDLDTVGGLELDAGAFAIKLQCLNFKESILGFNIFISLSVVRFLLAAAVTVRY